MAKKRRDQSITQLCGGGRAAIVPAQDARDGEVSDGALRLYTAMCGHAKANGELHISLKRYAKQIGKNIRTIQRYKKELEELGWLEQLHEGDKAIGHFRVIRDPAARRKIQLANIPKLKARQRRKTPHATRMSQARCDTDDAQNMSREHDPLLSPDRSDQSQTLKSLARKQTNQLTKELGAIRSIKANSSRATESQSSRLAKDRRNSGYWPKWIERSCQVENGWQWFIETSGEIGLELGIQGPEADRILEQCLLQAKSTDASLSRLRALVTQAIEDFKSNSNHDKD